MINKLLCLAFVALPCMAFAENHRASESMESGEFYKYEAKQKMDEERRERIREETRREIDGNRSLEYGDPCLIEPSLPGCSSKK